MADVVENEVALYWLDEDGIIHCQVKAGIDQTEALARDSLRVFGEVGGGRPRPVVLDVRHIKTMTREARACYTGPEGARVFKAMGLVVASSSVARAMVNFVLAVSRPDYPARLFASEEEALAWVRTFREP